MEPQEDKQMTRAILLFEWFADESLILNGFSDGDSNDRC